MKPRKLKRAIFWECFLLVLCFALDYHADDKVVVADPSNPIVRLREHPGYSERLSHKTHTHFVKKLKSSKNDCTDCHRLDKKQKSYELERDFCKNCHTPRPPEPWNPPHEARKLEGVLFDHSKHDRTKSKRKRQCIECHEITVNDAQTWKNLLIAPDRCIACHTKEKVAIPVKMCARCHSREEKNRVAPKNHGKNWPIHHGAEARFNPVLGHGKQCALCHANTSCVACHRTKRPKSHTGLWRLRMHGTEAQWDRQRCKICHETGACVSCHRRTKPISHRGAWRTGHGRTVLPNSEEHCTTCHSPGWCVNCHKGRGR